MLGYLHYRQSDQQPQRKFGYGTLSVPKSDSTEINSSKEDSQSSIHSICDLEGAYWPWEHNNRSCQIKPNSLSSGHPLNKEKSELCRKYMDTGSCPYGLRCKFAHGTHQLRQNQQANNRYKTKECGTFFKEGYCRFGNRCNFLHTKHNSEGQKKDRIVKILGNYRECLYEMREQSKLLKLLNLEDQ